MSTTPPNHSSDSSDFPADPAAAALNGAALPPGAAKAELDVQDSLITYPCRFPIKVMGAKVDGFVAALEAVAKQFDPTFDASQIELRDSKGGNYQGVTLNVWATSRAQLDDLYRALTSHPMVKVVL